MASSKRERDQGDGAEPAGDASRLLSRAAPPRADVETALQGLRGAGGTTLHDAVVFGSALSQANTLPAILLIFTDGQDTASWTSAVRALDVLRTTNVVVYTNTMREGCNGPFRDQMRDAVFG